MTKSKVSRKVRSVKKTDAAERLQNLRDSLPNAQQALVETLANWHGDAMPLTRLAMFLDLCSAELDADHHAETDPVQS